LTEKLRCILLITKPIEGYKMAAASYNKPKPVMFFHEATERKLWSKIKFLSKNNIKIRKWRREVFRKYLNNYFKRGNLYYVQSLFFKKPKS
jgi:hypothetical protein